MKSSAPFDFWARIGIGIAAMLVLGLCLGCRGPMETVPAPPPTGTISTLVSPESPLPTSPPVRSGPSDFVPDFTLDRSDGDTFALQDQLGQGPVVLAFFQAFG